MYVLSYCSQLLAVNKYWINMGVCSTNDIDHFGKHHVYKG